MNVCARQASRQFHWNDLHAESVEPARELAVRRTGDHRFETPTILAREQPEDAELRSPQFSEGNEVQYLQ